MAKSYIKLLTALALGFGVVLTTSVLPTPSAADTCTGHYNKCLKERDSGTYSCLKKKPNDRHYVDCYASSPRSCESRFERCKQTKYWEFYKGGRAAVSGE
jgi:hypothetical protein